MLLVPVHMGSQVLSPSSLEVNMCDLSRWEHRSWHLSLHTGSQVLISYSSLEVTLCNPSRWEHGSWDLPFHMGPQVLRSRFTWRQSVRSQPLRAWKLGHAISHKVSSPESQFTWGQSMQSQPLRAWKLGLTTSHGVPSLKSQVWHGCLHGDTFWRWGSWLVLGVGSHKS